MASLLVSLRVKERMLAKRKLDENRREVGALKKAPARPRYECKYEYGTPTTDLSMNFSWKQEVGRCAGCCI